MNVAFLFSALLSIASPKPVPAPPVSLTIYSRDIYPGDDATFDTLRTSGFTTVILSSFYIHADGDVYSGDSHRPIIHDGKYICDPVWLRRIASLKKRPVRSRVSSCCWKGGGTINPRIPMISFATGRTPLRQSRESSRVPV